MRVTKEKVLLHLSFFFQLIFLPDFQTPFSFGLFFFFLRLFVAISMLCFDITCAHIKYTINWDGFHSSAKLRPSRIKPCIDSNVFTPNIHKPSAHIGVGPQGGVWNQQSSVIFVPSGKILHDSRRANFQAGFGVSWEPGAAECHRVD